MVQAKTGKITERESQEVTSVVSRPLIRQIRIQISQSMSTLPNKKDESELLELIVQLFRNMKCCFFFLFGMVGSHAVATTHSYYFRLIY